MVCGSGLAAVAVCWCAEPTCTWAGAGLFASLLPRAGPQVTQQAMNAGFPCNNRLRDGGGWLLLLCVGLRPGAASSASAAARFYHPRLWYAGTSRWQSACGRRSGFFPCQGDQPLAHVYTPWRWKCPMLTRCVLQEKDKKIHDYKGIKAETLRLLHCQADGMGLQV